MIRYMYLQIHIKSLISTTCIGLIVHFFQGCELAIGNINGELLVYKGSDSKPWRKASELGMVGMLLIGVNFQLSRYKLLIDVLFQ